MIELGIKIMYIKLNNLQITRKKIIKRVLKVKITQII